MNKEGSSVVLSGVKLKFALLFTSTLPASRFGRTDRISDKAWIIEEEQEMHVKAWWE